MEKALLEDHRFEYLIDSLVSRQSDQMRFQRD